MSNQSKNLRDLLADCIVGDTINTQISTATDLIRAVTTTDGTALKISLGGGSTTGTTTFTGNVIVTGDLTVSGNTYQSDSYISSEYFVGPKDTDGSWRFYIDPSGNLVFEVRVGGNWVNKGQFQV